VRTATVAETDPFYLVEGRFVGVVHDFALAEDYRSGAFDGEVDRRELPFRADRAHVVVGTDELFIANLLVGQSAALLNVTECGDVAFIELLICDERVIEAIVNVEDRFVVIRFEQCELFKCCRLGCSDCLFDLSNLRTARVCEGFTALAAKRVFVVPFQKGELMSAVRAEVGHVAINFVARDKKLCVLFEKSLHAERN